MSIDFHLRVLCGFGTTKGLAVEEIQVFLVKEALKLKISKFLQFHTMKENLNQDTNLLMEKDKKAEKVQYPLV